jgi:hypothetical protein
VEPHHFALGVRANSHTSQVPPLGKIILKITLKSVALKHGPLEALFGGTISNLHSQRFSVMEASSRSKITSRNLSLPPVTLPSISNFTAGELPALSGSLDREIRNLDEDSLNLARS